MAEEEVEKDEVEEERWVEVCARRVAAEELVEEAMVTGRRGDEDGMSLETVVAVLMDRMKGEEALEARSTRSKLEGANSDMVGEWRRACCVKEQCRRFDPT